MPQNYNETDEWADREQGNQRQANARVVADEFAHPLSTRKNQKFDAYGARQENRRNQ